MSYLRNEKKRSKAIFAVFIASLALALFYYGGGPVAKWSSGKSASISAGLFNLQFPFSESWGEFIVNFKTKKSLYRENTELKNSLEQLSLQLENQKLITEENLRLKEVLGRIGDREIVLSRVLAKPNRSLYDTLIIDAGIPDKIKEGDLVFASQSVIGKIARTSENSSRVKLFSSPGEEINVNVGEKNIQAVAYGLGVGNLEIRLPKEAEVKEGDIVSSPEIGAEILGTVGHIAKKDSDSFQKILVKTTVNINELGWVEILRIK